MASILYSDYRLANEMIDAREVVKASTEMSDEQIAKFLETSSVRAISKMSEPSDIPLLNGLLDRLFESGVVKREEISHLIFTSYADYFNGQYSVPYVLQQMQRLKNASVFLVYQDCCSTLQSMTVGKALLSAGMGTAVLILSVHIVRSESRCLDLTVLGDGAGVMVLKRDGGRARIIDTLCVSDGSNSYSEYQGEEKIDRIKLLRIGADTILELIRRNGLKPQDIKYIVPQNINGLGYRVYAHYMRMAKGAFFLDNIGLGGHIGDVDTIRNYTDVVVGGKVAPGDKVVLYGLGATLSDVSYNTVLLDIEERGQVSGQT